MSGRISNNAATSKIEFDVEMTCESCGHSVRRALEGTKGIKTINVDVLRQSVVVESNLPSEVVKDIIENVGIKAVVKGIGSNKGNDNLGAAVAELRGDSGIYGIVRFHQISTEECVVDGTIDGLTKGDHGLHIHEYGDLSNGCDSIGDHYNPTNASHGGRLSEERHYGDLGNVSADDNGRASFLFRDNIVKTWDIIGRSLAVTSNSDDLGQNDNKKSKYDGDSGQRLACAIIARSAGLFENPKRLCQCDGVSVWEERNVPSAGKSRNESRSSS